MRRIECALEELKFKNPVLEELKTIENLWAKGLGGRMGTGVNKPHPVLEALAPSPSHCTGW